jgi:hypothetical protein
MLQHSVRQGYYQTFSAVLIAQHNPNNLINKELFHGWKGGKIVYNGVEFSCTCFFYFYDQTRQWLPLTLESEQQTYFNVVYHKEE